MVNTNKKSLKEYLLIAAVALVLIFGAMLQMYFTTNTRLKKHTFEELQGEAERNALIVNETIVGHEYVLLGYAEYLSTVADLSASNPDVPQILDAIIKSSPLYYASLVDATGVGVTSGDHEINISQREYFINTKATKKSTFQYIETNYIDGKPLFLLSLPVIKGGEVVGVLTGGHTTESFDTLLENKRFEGYTNEIVCTKEGKIMAMADRTINGPDLKNIFDITTLESSKKYDGDSIGTSMRDGDSFTLELKRKKSVLYASFVPITIFGESYYMICVVDEEGSDNSFGFLKGTATILVAEVVLIAVGAIMVILHLINKREDLIKQERDYYSQAEEHYRLIENLSDSVMFEVDIPNDTIRFNSRYAKVFGHEPYNESYSAIFTDNNGVLLSEDAAKMAELRKLADEGVDEVTAEIRLLGGDGKYYWTKVIMLALRGTDGNLVKIIGKLENIDKARRHMDLLQTKAEKDSLTDLYNHDTMRVKSTEILLQESTGTHAFIIADLDGLKHINDTYGHHVGDEVIVEFANVLKKSFRSTDIVGRLGGDEFAVFAKSIKSRTALEEKARKISVALGKTKISERLGESFSASVGIAFSPDHGCDFDDLYKKADKALYVAKSEGKAGYRVYKSGDGTDI